MHLHLVIQIAAVSHALLEDHYVLLLVKLPSSPIALAYWPGIACAYVARISILSNEYRFALINRNTFANCQLLPPIIVQEVVD